MKESQVSPDYIDRVELARRLGVCVRTIAYMQERREIPAYKFGRTGRAIRYRYDEVVAALEANNRIDILAIRPSRKPKSGTLSEKTPV